MRKQTKLWKTKGGQKIRICDMEDSHIVNAYKMCQRSYRHFIYNAIEAGYEFLESLQGEQAILSVERELACLEDDSVTMEEEWPIANKLWLDIIRRRIEGQVT